MRVDIARSGTPFDHIAGVEVSTADGALPISARSGTIPSAAVHSRQCAGCLTAKTRMLVAVVSKISEAQPAVDECRDM